MWVQESIQNTDVYLELIIAWSLVIEATDLNFDWDITSNVVKSHLAGFLFHRVIKTKHRKQRLS